MHRKGKWVIGIRSQNGKKDDYELKVCRVLSRHPDGTPKALEMLLDTKLVNIQGGEEFMTVFAPCIMMGNEGAG